MNLVKSSSKTEVWVISTLRDWGEEETKIKKEV